MEIRSTEVENLFKKGGFISFINLAKNNYREWAATLKTPFYSLVRELKKTNPNHVGIDLGHSQYCHDCLFSINMSYGKRVGTGVKGINKVIGAA